MTIQYDIMIFLYKMNARYPIFINNFTYRLFIDRSETYITTSDTFYWKHGIRIHKPAGSSTSIYWKASITVNGKSDNRFQQCIENDIAWLIAVGLPDKYKRMLLLGSSTSFQKETTIESITHSKITYLPTFP